MASAPFDCRDVTEAAAGSNKFNTAAPAEFGENTDDISVLDFGEGWDAKMGTAVTKDYATGNDIVRRASVHNSLLSR